ncbi:MAG TPA: hypothetical protein PLB91_15780 [Spirochaetales bacterium]|nr:hypothetical protein [Spirochaetales bacterium]HRY53579.1 hypothetical protein [Spirochaetia bacterium]HRZ63399.1 hypothetical protein [Spirochaetia bacterium]
MEQERKQVSRIDLPLVALDLAILLGVAILLAASGPRFGARSREASLKESGFLTTEWRLMRELKERTDRELRDKDREIAELRARYLSLKDAGSSSESLAELEEEMRRAEAEREALLSTRIKAATASPAAAELAAARPRQRASVPEAALPEKDSALSELLRRDIEALERELAASRSSAASLERELAGLRLAAEAAAGQAPSPTAAPAPGPAAEGPPPIEPARAIAEGDPVAAALEFLERERAAAAGRPLELSDLKTRALLRAIVRAPAIRAEYPELLGSLDRYLALLAEEAYLRGRREACAEAIEALGELARGR